MAMASINKIHILNNPKIKQGGIRMKKLAFLLVGLITIGIFSSCTVRTTVAPNPSTRVTVKADYGVLKGLVKITDGDNLYLIVDPDCKCRRSYKIKGKHKLKLRKYRNRTVEVEGYIKNYSPWSGEIEVIKIKKIW